jgi:hypothetical protein
VIDDVQESVWSESKALGLTLVIQINGPPPAAGFSWISPAVSWDRPHVLMPLVQPSGMAPAPAASSLHAF